ncbi:MAG: hypothetical protein SPG69_12145 [Bacteroides pyogenes]|uniref:helix-turn-helix domain-containing protein n=1 Tax=Bacteroides pyogenes TaxID=310300 RepID=UPI002A9158EE|nr:hypothetical protein [Bacteroides pyogenes]MDY5354748.1 hypothetical protein [Bacteroides pyogenes]
MTTTRPQVDPDGLYNQKQVADALCISRKTVARYEASGFIKFKIRKAGNSKITTGQQIIKCWETTYL